MPPEMSTDDSGDEQDNYLLSSKDAVSESDESADIPSYSVSAQHPGIVAALRNVVKIFITSNDFQFKTPTNDDDIKHYCLYISKFTGSMWLDAASSLLFKRLAALRLSKFTLSLYKARVSTSESLRSFIPLSIQLLSSQLKKVFSAFYTVELQPGSIGPFSCDSACSIPETEKVI